MKLLHRQIIWLTVLAFRQITPSISSVDRVGKRKKWWPVGSSLSTITTQSGLMFSFLFIRRRKSDINVILSFIFRKVRRNCKTRALSILSYEDYLHLSKPVTNMHTWSPTKNRFYASLSRDITNALIARCGVWNDALPLLWFSGRKVFLVSRDMKLRSTWTIWPSNFKSQVVVTLSQWGY